MKERGQPRSVHQEASCSGPVLKMALRKMLSRDVFNGFGNCLILFRLSECCPMHAKHLGVEWSCEYVQGTQGVSERHGTGRARHSAKETLGDLRQVGWLGAGSHPVTWVNKPPISCPENQLRLLACVTPQELLSQPPWAACELSPLPTLPFLPQRHPPSISSLPRCTDLLPLAVFGLVVYFLPGPPSLSPLDPRFGFLKVVYQGCPEEGGRKGPKSPCLPPSHRKLFLLSKHSHPGDQRL